MRLHNMTWQNLTTSNNRVATTLSHLSTPGWSIVLVCLVLAYASPYALAQVTSSPTPGARQPLSQHKAQDNVRITLETDRQTIGIADRLRLTLSVDAPLDTQVVLPKITDTLGPFTVHKHVQTGPEATTPQTQQWKHEYVLETSESGELTIPALTFSYSSSPRPKTDADETSSQHISTDPLVITVTSILPNDADVKAPQDIAPPVTLSRQGLPPWLWTGAAALATLVLVMAVIWWYRRRRQTTTTVPLPPQPAHVLALDALRRLQQQDFIGQRQIEPFYVQVSAILRRYVEWRFNLRAPEQTTEEFLSAAATSHGLLGTHRGLLSTFLEHCDLVKFARHEPTALDMQQAFDHAKTFVEQTADNQAMVVVDSAGAQV